MDAAIVISVASLGVAVGGLLWNRHTWRVARETDVRVMASHVGSGIDMFGPEPDAVQVQHVIAVRVFNHGEQPEYVMYTGVESATGEPLANDKPTADKIIDEPPPEARLLAARAQLVTEFKLPPDATSAGFVGYAELGTGRRIYSVPGLPDPGLDGAHSQVMEALREAAEGDPTPEGED